MLPSYTEKGLWPLQHKTQMGLKKKKKTSDGILKRAGAHGLVGTASVHLHSWLCSAYSHRTRTRSPEKQPLVEPLKLRPLVPRLKGAIDGRYRPQMAGLLGHSPKAASRLWGVQDLWGIRVCRAAWGRMVSGSPGKGVQLAPLSSPELVPLSAFLFTP